MIPSLEELRKRLLDTAEAPPAPVPSGRRLTFASSARGGPSPQRRLDSTIYLGDAGPERVAAQPEAAVAAEEPDEAEIQMAEPRADDELVEAVAPFFATVGGYREHLTQLAHASRSMRKFSLAADRVFAPLRDFRDRVQALLSSYAKPDGPAGALRERLDTIVWLSSTQKPARSGDDAAAAAFAKYLFEISRSLARAEALHARLAELTRVFDAADALRAQLRGLFQALDEFRTHERGERTLGDDQN